VTDAADALCATRERDTWQRSELQRILDEVAAEASASGSSSGTALALAEVQSLLADRLAGRPTRANFRTGHLTVCTLYPMRSVPHRVVCLLGLDDGEFPRKAPRDGDDLMLDDPLVGERDPRSEDRQLLLDALLAATEHLIITYTGNDERTNIPQPPAVPVGELLDVVDATVRADDGPARTHVVVRHPLQPFDPRNFEAGALVPDLTWSFDRVTLEGARGLTGPRADLSPFLPEPLPPPDARWVELEPLVRFVQQPVKAFLRQRLRISLGQVEDELDDALPIELDALERWGVGQRLLDACLAGVDGRAAIRAEIARGTLPPGHLGEPVVRDLYPIAAEIVAQAQVLIRGEAETEPLDVHVELPDGRVLTGTVPAVGGELLLQTTYSRVSAKHRLAAWVRLVAASASHPERELSTATVGRAGGNATVTVARIKPLGADAAERRSRALEQLALLIDLYDGGMREPLPVFCMSSAAYAEAAAAGRDPIAAARDAWTSAWNYPKEDAELEHQLVLDGKRKFDDLLAEPPHAGEQGDGWEMSETTRFGRLARRLWDGPLRWEEISSS
jgi:exodeoxyribonuclease V gamma subunit